jgi:hypothetical protein
MSLVDLPGFSCLAGVKECTYDGMSTAMAGLHLPPAAATTIPGRKDLASEVVQR